MLSSTLLGITQLAVASAISINQFSSPGRLLGSSFGIPNRNATYDYIIIGGGQAGSVVAARLTEHSNATVAIIEGGSFYEIINGNQSQIPYYSENGAGSSVDDYNPLNDWGLETVPQVSGKVVHYAQGKNLGGSSGRNQMLYHRPTKGYYEAMADHVGDLSYTWDNMTTYLERSMTFTPPSAAVQSENNVTVPYDASAFLPYSNSSNPLQVSYGSYFQPISAYAPAAFNSLNLTVQPGFSSGILHGYGHWTSTIDPTTGLRSSAESSFLQEALSREALTVYVNSMVQNVIFNGNQTAIGVNVTSSNSARPRFYTISARKQVILSAGPYHSPQILMLSGIGPAATLSKFNIPVISALEGVGQNMWDTTNLGGPVYPLNTSIRTSAAYTQNQTLLSQAETQLLETGTGPLTNAGPDFAAWYKIPQNTTSTFSNATQSWLSSLPSDWPELELFLASTSRSLETSSNSMPVASITLLMIGTAGRGNMTISSSSIFDSPTIDPNWLRDPRDQEVAVHAFRLARQAIAALPAGVITGPEIFPGANVTSYDDLLLKIKGDIAAIHHASASCAMGRVGERDTVVDSHGRVVGVQGLRVIDSSSLVFTPPGHTQGVTYGHAEKLVDVLLRDLEGFTG